MKSNFVSQWNGLLTKIVLLYDEGNGKIIGKQGKKGNIVEERRKDKRTGMQSNLVIKKVDDGSETQVAINISDVSKSGIGFTCAERLQIGEVYESYLTIWTKEVIHAFLQIVRVDRKNDGEGYGYGATFVGMSVMESARIEVYQTVNDPEHK